MNIFEYLKNKLNGEPEVSPVDRILAKRWVKQRLKEMYPDLRSNPRALEEAYQALSLEPRPGLGKGGATMFEVVLPGKLD